MPTVTLKSLDQKLDDMKEMMRDHAVDAKMRQKLLDEHVVAIDRLQQVEASRVWHIRALWVSMMAAVFGWLFPR